MSYTLVLAEKPSVCRDLARIVGADILKKQGSLTYYEGNTYLVSNFRGHLVGLALPPIQDEKWGTWKIEDLPIVPEKFKFVPNGIGEQDIAGYTAHIKAIGELMNRKDVDSLICATDAGREGELIFRYVLGFVNCKKPFKRLWISSLTDESIKSGFENLLDGKEKDRMFFAGDCRNKIDWIFGMSMSRLYTILSGENVSIGRVQTPTLDMVVSRDNEIKNFSKTKFYTLTLENLAQYQNNDNDSDDNAFKDKETAEKIAKECSVGSFKVTSAESTEKKENRPRLFSLTSLQKEAKRKAWLLS